MFRFLLDENVRVELDEFFKSQTLDFIRLPSSTPDQEIAATSLREKRIVVTNDGDFIKLPKDKIFSIIWLKIPQKEVTTLITSFRKLIKECDQFVGKLIILRINEWEEFPLLETIEP